ncbi:MAG: hypothetical protein GXP25_11145 [Planctomycetes bacterium]|nr:hypothetical protein [Planctomycetota bacterium]
MVVFAYVALALALALAFYMIFIETRWFHLGEVTIHVRKSFPCRLTVLHLTDTHFRKSHGWKRRFIKGLAERPVDFVFATGDMIDAPHGIDNCVAALAALKPRYGTYFVLGGHDHYAITLMDTLHHLTHFRTSRRASRKNETEELIRRLTEIGVVVLVNEHRRITVDTHKLVLVGLDDPFLSRDDLDAAMDGVSPEDPTIMLVHAPDVIESAPERGVDVVFAGHTHGGQIRLPLIGALVTRSKVHRRHACGVFKVKDTVFHLNKGLGAGPITDFRLFCRPEATIVHIVPDEE